jgi:hypothetical protein
VDDATDAVVPPDPVGAGNGVTLRDLGVIADEAAEAVSP